MQTFYIDKVIFPDQANTFQPEISSHFAHFPFESKILKFQEQGIHERKNPENVSELTNLWLLHWSQIHFHELKCIEVLMCLVLGAKTKNKKPKPKKKKKKKTHTHTRKNAFFSGKKVCITKFSTSLFCSCEQFGAPAWKKKKKLKFLKKQNCYDFLKNCIFRKLTTDFENHTKRQSMHPFGRWPLYPTEQVQSILQPEISSHFAHFRFESKILKFQEQGIHERKNPENVSELTNLWLKKTPGISLQSDQKWSLREWTKVGVLKTWENVQHLSRDMSKRVFGSFRPGQTQTGLRRYRS